MTSKEHVDRMVNSFAFVKVGTGASFVFDGPFPFLRDGGHFEVAIPVDPDDHAGIHRDVAENYLDNEGNIGIALADGELHASGTIEAVEIVDGQLAIRVDDPEYVSRSEIEVPKR